MNVIQLLENLIIGFIEFPISKIDTWSYCLEWYIRFYD